MKNVLFIVVGIMMLSAMSLPLRAGTSINEKQFVQCLDNELRAEALMIEIDSYRTIVARNVVEMDKQTIAMQKYKGREKFTDAEKKEIRHAMAIVKIGNESITTLANMQAEFNTLATTIKTQCHGRDVETEILKRVCTVEKYKHTLQCQKPKEAKPDVQKTN